MFRYEREQKVCTIGGVKSVANQGKRAPLLIGNMFQKGDLILESRKGGKFWIGRPRKSGFVRWSASHMRRQSRA